MQRFLEEFPEMPEMPEFPAGWEKNQRNKVVRKLRKRHPGCAIQVSDHGAGRFSVQVFDGQQLVADYNL